MTTHPLLTWLSTTLFAVFRDLSDDKNPNHPDLVACFATLIPSMLHLHPTVHSLLYFLRDIYYNHELFNQLDTAVLTILLFLPANAMQHAEGLVLERALVTCMWCIILSTWQLHAMHIVWHLKRQYYYCKLQSRLLLQVVQLHNISSLVGGREYSSVAFGIFQYGFRFGFGFCVKPRMEI